MNILLTNDDGINAPGLAALVQEMSKIGQVTVVAPATEMSAVGHAITLSDPLRVTRVEKGPSFHGFAVSGTPADCVKIAYWALLGEHEKPNLLISGINLGSNSGINTIYSGTVSAATEGAILGIPSFAISLATYTNPDFSFAARFARQLARHELVYRLPKSVFLNVNIPAVPEGQIKGVQYTRQGLDGYVEEFQVRKDPRNIDYYWLTGEKKEIEKGMDVDDNAIRDNKISITPVHYDLTCYDVLKELQKMEFNLGDSL
ncbi:5'/3'-nucleotidase SurE [candidate division KSB1 bacterium]|nr:5'/3'-nucleotidase SurE [candidate division KSB1 bacterium]